MTPVSRPAAALVLALGAVASARAADHGTPAPPPRFTADTARVRVDLVVRDKKGEILRGLDAGSVEVYEDGVRQDVEGLEFVEAGPSGAAVAEGAQAPAAGAASTRTPTVVAIAFDRLSPGGRRFAHQAVLEYI